MGSKVHTSSLSGWKEGEAIRMDKTTHSEVLVELIVSHQRSLLTRASPQEAVSIPRETDGADPPQSHGQVHEVQRDDGNSQYRFAKEKLCLINP